MEELEKVQEIEKREEINVTEEERIKYDNEITASYKYAQKRGVPISLIIMVREGDEVHFESVKDIVSEAIAKHKNFRQIVEQIRELSEDVSLETIAYLYYDELKPGVIEESINIFNEIDRYYTDQGLPKQFNSYNDIMTNAESLKRQIQKGFENEQRIVNNVIELQNELVKASKKPLFPITEVKYTATLLSFEPQFKERNDKTSKKTPHEITVEDGLDIFNEIIPSLYIPYVRYNKGKKEEMKSYYKVYTGLLTEDEPRYDYTIPSDAKTRDGDTIYMTLWYGNPQRKTIKNSPQSSFVLVEYHLETNYLTVVVPYVDFKVEEESNELYAYKKVSEAMPLLNLGIGDRAKVRGEFNIFNLDFDDVSLLDVILTQPTFYNYLYVEENKKPYAEKKRLDIHYRSLLKDDIEATQPSEDTYISNSALVSVTLTKRVLESNEKVIIKEEENSEELNDKIPYMHVIITKANSVDVVEEFSKIFRLLMRIYVEQRDSILQEYLNLIPEISELQSINIQREKKVTKKLQTKSRKKRDQLREKAPELYPRERGAKLNTRDCQCTYQPIIIEREEIPDWEAYTFPTSRGQKRRKVVTFPKIDPTEPTKSWFFACPNDSIPYVGLHVNETGSRDNYEYIPCCYADDQSLPGKENAYNAYYHGGKFKKKEKSGGKSDNIIKTNKILALDAIGTLPTSIDEILSTYSENSGQMLRLGVPKSLSSLIHCVLIATEDDRYLEIMDEEDSEEQLEEYVLNIRSELDSKVEIGLLKQEMYDYPEERILDLLVDEDTFLDPNIFFRAVEEYFNINIYTFGETKDKEEGQIEQIEIPRHKLFHVHTPQKQKRKTVLIYRNWGTEKDSEGVTSRYPQCELIIDRQKEEKGKNYKDIKIFDEAMTNLCQSLMLATMGINVWFLRENLQGFYNPFSMVNFAASFNYTAKSQYIDSYGKMRALIVPIGEEDVTFFLPPSQPENLEQTNEFPRARVSTTLSLLPNPSALSRYNGIVLGFWYDLEGIEQFIYVPITPLPVDHKDVVEFKDLKEGPEDPFLKLDINVTDRLRKIKSTTNILVELIRWLFDFVDETAQDFLMKFAVIDNFEIEDSVNYYDFSRVTRRLPILKDINDALKYLHKITPTFIREVDDELKIVLYNAELANKLVNDLSDYKLKSLGMNEDKERYIKNFYGTHFKEVPGTVTLIGAEEMRLWRESIVQKSKDLYKLNTKIKHKFIELKEPFFYYDEETNVYYLVQNVILGSLQRALNVAKVWSQKILNIGYDAFELEETVPYVIFKIGLDGKLVFHKNVTGLSDEIALQRPDVFRVLLYEKTEKLRGGYAALLVL